MNQSTERTANQCATSDELLRYVRKQCDADDYERIERHLDECDRCRKDAESLRNLSLDLLACDLDVEDLESFQPTEQCRALTDRKIRQFAGAKGTPPDPQTHDHLADCAYCRQRLLRAAETAPGSLRNRILNSMLADAMAAADLAVMKLRAAEPWLAGRLVEQLCAWVDEAGGVVVEGLEGLLAGAGPRAVAVSLDDRGALEGMMGGALGPSAGEQAGTPAAGATWQIPLGFGEPPAVLTLVAKPSETPEQWSLSCRLTGADEAATAAKIEVRTPDEGREYAGDLAPLADRPILLREGLYRVAVKVGQDVRELEVALGGEPTG